MKFIKLKLIAISILPKATAIPIAPVLHKLAAVAVPDVPSCFFRIAPPPIKPIPVITPCKTLASASAVSNTSIPNNVNPHVATATIGNVRKPALLASFSRSHAMGKEIKYAVPTVIKLCAISAKSKLRMEFNECMLARMLYVTSHNLLQVKFIILKL